MFNPYLQRWRLVSDGAAITTPTARLSPVRRGGAPAMLKFSLLEEERFGAALMEWWNGDGAARVLAREGSALLLERAMRTASLAEMSQTGRDDEACRILCSVAARLHAPRPQSMPELIPLAHYFAELKEAAASHGGLFEACAEAARDLLHTPREVCPLHGDLHHGNVLDFGARGWLAIDARGLLGERGFDFANIFLNPDLADPTRPVATEPERFARRLQIVAAAAGLERRRLLRWITAFAGLSAAWILQEDKSAQMPLAIAEMAAAELERG
jgi:streptomycin 6-kinase